MTSFKHLCSKNQHILFWLTFTILFVSFFIIKLGTSSYTESLYNQGNFDQLNLLSNSTGERQLEFYLGQVIDVSFGPLSVAMAGFCFLVFALKFLKDASFKKYALAVLGYLLLSKYDVLFNPPYGDPLIAQMAEGIWLLKHNFNYVELFQQPGFPSGGPVAYFITIYPAFIGIMYYLIPHVKTFLCINHLITFALAAGIIAAFRDMLRNYFGPQKSLLISLLLLFTPLFQTHSEFINMEMPLLFFSVFSMNALVKRNYRNAALFAIAALSIKIVGMITCVAVFGVYLFEQFFGKKKTLAHKRSVLEQPRINSSDFKILCKICL